MHGVSARTYMNILAGLLPPDLTGRLCVLGTGAACGRVACVCVRRGASSVCPNIVESYIEDGLMAVAKAGVILSIIVGYPTGNVGRAQAQRGAGSQATHAMHAMHAMHARTGPVVVRAAAVGRHLCGGS
jgi:hypothetical protein